MTVKRYAPINIANASLSAHPVYFVCDTTAELPNSGLKLGDTALAKDTNTLYKAASSTTWIAQLASPGVLASDFLFATSNTTLQPITGMSFTLGTSATEIWEVIITMELAAVNAAMDAKFGWGTMPAGATARWGGTNVNLAAYQNSVIASTTVPALATESGVLTVGTGNNISGVMFIGKVYGGGTAGSVQFLGAQNTSDAGQLTAKRGSVLRATRILG